MSRIDKEKKVFGVKLVMPALLISLCVLLFPMVYSIIMSFFDWRLTSPSRSFIGFGNYLRALSDFYFQSAIYRNLLFAFISIPFQLIVGFFVALLLSSGIKGEKWARILFIMPFFTTPAVVGFNARWIFSSRGILNQLSSGIGLSQVSWLADTNFAFIAILIVDIWQFTPLVCLILLAGLQGIPTELEDASAVDGASFFQRVFYINVPLLRPYFVLVIIMQMISAFRIFDVPYIMTGGGPADATMLASMQLYRTAFSSLNFGYASAQSCIILLFMLVISSILLIGELRRTKK
ncbi:Melibiose/raffinose/stachyose import permease protein MelD [subsurface metagenome]